jgi:hypothetical protein
VDSLLKVLSSNRFSNVVLDVVDVFRAAIAKRKISYKEILGMGITAHSRLYDVENTKAVQSPNLIDNFYGVASALWSTCFTSCFPLSLPFFLSVPDHSECA